MGAVVAGAGIEGAGIEGAGIEGAGIALTGIIMPGGVTTTVTIDESVAVKLFAVPSAVAVFTVVTVKFI
jgi:hypothetical protein